jgi:hypothetical protein
MQPRQRAGWSGWRGNWRGWALLLLALALLLAVLLNARWQPPPTQPTLLPAGCVPHAVALDAAQARVLFFDDFSQPAHSRVQAGATADMQAAFVGGAYLLTLERAGVLGWALLADDSSKYAQVRIQTQAALVQGDATTSSGLLFRYQDENNFYLFNVAHNGFYNLELIESGQQITLIDWTPAVAIVRAPATESAVPSAEPPVPPAQRPANTLAVELRGERIALFVNGVKLTETLDNTFAVGRVGLAAQTFVAGEATVCFEAVLVEQLAQSEQAHEHGCLRIGPQSDHRRFA